MNRAALVVLLAGCWKSSTPAEPTAPPPDAARAVPDTRAPEPEPESEPPAPVTVQAPSPTPVARCTGGFIARVIAIRVHTDRTNVTVSRGARDGVTLAWSATLLTKPETPAPMLGVSQTTTTVVVTRTADQIKAAPHVELCPPPPTAQPQPPSSTAHCVVARVIQTTAKGATTFATLSVGLKHGIQRSWVASQHTLHLPCQIVRVDLTRLLCETTATVDQLTAEPMFTICP